jgi:ribosomal protein S18 acetylase RimI-like enzyme
MQIRILQSGDQALLDAIDGEVFDDPLDARAAGEFLRDPRHHLVAAIDDGVVVGFASAVHYVHPDKPLPELWINEVGVASSHQGRGLGKAIMATLLDHARELGCAEAWVLTERTNHAAMRLYESSGGIEAPDETVMFNFPLDRTRAADDVTS